MDSLSRFENKKVKITTEDGHVFSGIAEVFPSGYGLHEFGRAEESVLIDGTYVFRSDIRDIGLCPESRKPVLTEGQMNSLMEELLEGPCRIVDILPERVPAGTDGQYFAVERYFLQPERIRPLRRRYAEILLRLNCYDEMTVSFDSCESWVRNPDPDMFAEQVAGLSGNAFLRAVFEARRVMIDLDPGDTYMTVYDPDSALADRLQALAAAKGLFVWDGGDDS